jgi:Zn-dependent protease
MKWSLYIGSVKGIKIFIHWTFLILIVWIVASNMIKGAGADAILLTIGFVLTIFACVILHELGHALTAKKFNHSTRDIIILPIGGVARLESIPEKPIEELLVAVAGPLVNVAISGILFFVLVFSNGFPIMSNINAISPDNFLYMLFLVNLVLAFFNLIPAFPMDGGRVLRALLTLKLNRVKATRIAASAGQVIAIFFVLFGLFNNPVLVLIGIFVYLGAQSESDQVKTKSNLKGFKVRDVLMQKYEVLDSHDTLQRAVDILLNGQTKDFLVKEGENITGTLSRNELIKGLSEKGKDAPVKNAMNHSVIYLNPDSPLDDILLNMNSKNQSIFPVMDELQLLGVLDTENILEFLMVRNAMAGK